MEGLGCISVTREFGKYAAHERFLGVCVCLAIPRKLCRKTQLQLSVLRGELLARAQSISEGEPLAPERTAERDEM